VTAPPRVFLPDLTGPKPAPSPSGWMALLVETQASAPLVNVPSLDDARRCAARAEASGRCEATVVSFDPPDGTTLIAVGAGGATVEVRVTPGVPRDVVPELTVVLSASTPPAPATTVTVPGKVVGPGRERIVFAHAIPAASGTESYTYTLSLAGYAGPTAEITVAPSATETVAVDRCALTLTAMTAPAGVALLTPPATWPTPPLLAVDAAGCIVAAWAVNEHGWVLVPGPSGSVELRQSVRGGVRATITAATPIVDAIFWKDTIAVLTATEVTLHDLGGGPVHPPVSRAGFTTAVALGIADEGFLLIVDRGALPGAPSVTYLARDGSGVLGPAAFEARGWYARHRSPVFVLDRTTGSYSIDPARVGEGCCVSAARLLTAAEALFFQMIDDLPGLRQRPAYPLSGWVILGAAQPADVLDAGRPGTQWHRILLFGEIPHKCAVGVETRTFDDALIADLLLAGDPLLTADGWSPEVTVGPGSRVPVEAPGDERIAAGDAMVLAGPGRFLWIRLTLQGSGGATPRITHIEIEQPRLGTSRFLPKVYRDSTPTDDFLRRWLALFEETSWNGIAARMDTYGALFDPRTAPAVMLPYLAGWLEIALFPKLVADTLRLRRVLVRAAEIAETRGTPGGIELLAKLYLDLDIHVVESFRVRSRFLLGIGHGGEVEGGVVGPILGAETVLTAERPPIYLDDGPPLGSGFLDDEPEHRTGAIPYHFEVLVPARQLCAGEDLSLLRALLDLEKPAYTTYSIRLTAPAGWVLGASSVVGQEVGPGFDRSKLDPATYGLVILNGPPPPKPIGLGWVLGQDARLTAPAGPPRFQLDATVGRTTRLGA
jgi:phage tail-like protein